MGRVNDVSELEAVLEIGTVRQDAVMEEVGTAPPPVTNPPAANPPAQQPTNPESGGTQSPQKPTAPKYNNNDKNNGGTIKEVVIEKGDPLPSEEQQQPEEKDTPEEKEIVFLRIQNPEDDIISNDTVEAQEGQSLDLDSILTNGNVPEFVEWESSDTDVATVDENGVVTFLKAGNVTISAHQMSDDTEEAMIECSSAVYFHVAAPEPAFRLGDYWQLILIAVMALIIVVLLVRQNIQKKRRQAARRRRKAAQSSKPVQTRPVEEETTAVQPVVAAPAPVIAPVEEAARVVQPHSGVRSAVFQAIGARKDQQDSYGMTDPALYPQQGILALVADGMGGLANGKAVSAALVNTFLGEFRSVADYGKPQDVLMKLAISANQRINQMLVGQDRSGSTLVSVLVRDGCLHFLTVGDSRIYLYRAGALLQLNREHIYQEELAVSAVNCQVPISQVTGDRQAHALTSFFGSGTIKHMDRNYEGIRLVPGDRVLLCSDGVFGTLTQVQMEYALSQDVRRAADLLRDMVREAGKAHQDNNTGLILEYLG